MRRYNLSPTITQEVGEAMTIIGLVAAGTGCLDSAGISTGVQMSEMRWVHGEEDAVSEIMAGMAKASRTVMPYSGFANCYYWLPDGINYALKG